MSSNAPIAKALALAGSKSELVEKVKALATASFWVDRFASEDGWARLSNRQLVRLHTLFTEVARRFGSRYEVIAAIAAAEGHGNDADYKTSLERHPLPRLWDQLKSAERRNRPARAPGANKASRDARLARDEAAKAARPARVAKPAANKPAPKNVKASKTAKGTKGR